MVEGEGEGAGENCKGEGWYSERVSQAKTGPFV